MKLIKLRAEDKGSEIIQTTSIFLEALCAVNRVVMLTDVNCCCELGTEILEEAFIS